MKKYTKAPLPFQGQKRRWRKEVEDFARQLPEGATVLDLFGGSGFLSHTIKYVRPDLRVIWNDYDDYASRLARIPQTNAYIARLREALKGYPAQTRIVNDSPEYKAVKDILAEAEQAGADMLTLYATLCFSGNVDYVVNKEKYYNNVPISDYSSDGYLVGVERVSTEYKVLLRAYEGAIILVDPPYLTTDSSRYSRREAGAYWGMTAHLELIEEVAKNRGRGFAFFTSSKSETLELAGIIRKYTGLDFPGANAKTTVKEHNTGIGKIVATEQMITNLTGL